MRWSIAAAVAGSFAVNGIAHASPPAQAHRNNGNNGNGPPPEVCNIKDPLPNIIVFMVDDLGYNQVGYHAKKTGNDEIKTPSIDRYAQEGIIMNRGYMTPWCAPSRAAFQTGRTNSFNQNVSNNIWSYDDSLGDGEGFVGGMPPGTVTIAKALKEYSSTTDKGVYKTSYAGKWGIGGTAWTNTPMGMGYDEFIGFWGDSIESCDGWQASTSVPPPRAFESAIISTAVPGYWQQSRASSQNVMCSYFQEQTANMTQQEIEIACMSTPRTPPKIIDLDILENTVSIIRNHDYSSGPLMHMHAPQLMHLPMQYPKAYDDPEDVGKEKGTPNNSDLRIGTSNAMRFVDDIFGNVTQAIKDAGQWDNTIVLFSSDNGGAIYTNSVNNNFPLRGAKFTAFEGGLRVPQFLSGGWIDKNIPSSRTYKSDTYVFVNDWGPTLLEMVGGTRDFLLNDWSGASYGNSMFEYIKNSVLPPNNNKNKPSQLERQVSYSLDLFFNVSEYNTHKMIYLGGKPTLTPRHWSPNFPQDDDLIPDFAYQSVQPCRKNIDTPYDCCVFNLDNDEGESYPIEVDCSEQKYIAENIYDNKEICATFPTICYTSITDLGSLPRNTEAYTLWSHYGASGPFTNSNASPIGTELDMQCVCDGFYGGSSTSQVDVQSFRPGIFAPPLCQDTTPKLPLLSPLKGVACKGFSRVPQGGLLEAYVAQGVPKGLMELILSVPLAAIIPEVNVAISEYVNRSGFVEWAAFAKFPFVVNNLDSCPQKKATITPLPLESLTPWLGQGPGGDITNPSPSDTLCATWSENWSWCPAIDNSEQNYIKSWKYDKEFPFGVFGDKKLEILKPVAGVPNGTTCIDTCKNEANGTAYIVPVSESHPWGIAGGLILNEESTIREYVETYDTMASCGDIHKRKQCQRSGCHWTTGTPETPEACIDALDTVSYNKGGDFEEATFIKEHPNSGGVWITGGLAWALIVPSLMFY